MKDLKTVHFFKTYTRLQTSMSFNRILKLCTSSKPILPYKHQSNFFNPATEPIPMCHTMKPEAMSESTGSLYPPMPHMDSAPTWDASVFDASVFSTSLYVTLIVISNFTLSSSTTDSSSSHLCHHPSSITTSPVKSSRQVLSLPSSSLKKLHHNISALNSSLNSSGRIHRNGRKQPTSTSF